MGPSPRTWYPARSFPSLANFVVGHRGRPSCTPHGSSGAQARQSTVTTSTGSLSPARRMGRAADRDTAVVSLSVLTLARISSPAATAAIRAAAWTPLPSKPSPGGSPTRRGARSEPWREPVAPTMLRKRSLDRDGAGDGAVGRGKRHEEPVSRVVHLLTAVPRDQRAQGAIVPRAEIRPCLIADCLDEARGSTMSVNMNVRVTRSRAAALFPRSGSRRARARRRSSWAPSRSKTLRAVSSSRQEASASPAPSYADARVSRAAPPRKGSWRLARGGRLAGAPRRPPARRRARASRLHAPAAALASSAAVP